MPTEKAEGIQTMKTCEALSRLGLDIELWVPRRFNKIKSDPFEYYGIKNKFPIKKIPTVDLVRFGRFGFLLHSFIFSFFCLLKLKKIKGVQVYSRDENVLCLISKTDRAIFWESHRGNINFSAKIVARVAKKIIVITSGLKALYEKNGVPEDKIVVIPDAVDVNFFDVNITKNDARKTLGINTEKKIIAYIGLLDLWKGYQTFLEASKIVSSDSLFVVIGGEENKIKELKVKYPQVLFLGFLPYNDLPVNQKIADVLVIPNSAKYEIGRLYTSPLKLFAHMASGVPILASDVPSIKEILDESTANFFIPDDSKSLAHCVDLTLNNYENALIKAGKAKLDVREYSWEKRAEKILKTIK